MNILCQAIEAYKSKSYHEALNLFCEAGDLYGSKLVEANIQLCKKALLHDHSVKSYSKEGVLINPNDYFDEIYLVNLPKESKRRLSAALHLRDKGIKYSLFEATNGNHGEPAKKYEFYKSRPLGQLQRYSEFNQREIKRGKHFIESAGAIGYIYTYLSILKDARSKKHKRILILEDDVLLDYNFHDKFDKFIRSIPEDWKILQFGASQYSWTNVDMRQAKLNGFYHPSQLDTCGSFAIAFNHQIFDELIEVQSAFESPFDHLAMGELYENHIGKCFVCYPNIVMPDVASSSIRNARNQIEHSMKMRWPIENFPYPLPRPSIAVIVQNSNNIKLIEKFDIFQNMPFSLRVYLNTEDGLRPVHGPAIFEKANYKSLILDGEVSVPQADFVAAISEEGVLSESELLAYIDSQLFGVQNKTCLRAISYSPINPISEKVSVIIPTYKRPHNLSKAINSVISQGYVKKEIIIVSDNGFDSASNKETFNVVNQFVKNNPNVEIKLIEHKFNRNGASARNTGLMCATGEFICFLDDDDIYLENRIEEATKKLKNLPTTVGAVYCGFIGWNSPVNDVSRYKAGDLTRELLLLDYKKHYLHTNTATYRRAALVAINGFDESYKRHQDIELNLRFFQLFIVDYVEVSGVRLSPEPSQVSNRIFDSEMFELKQKFLTQFSSLIDKLDAETRSVIYKRHWEEVARYTTDIDALTSYLSSLIENGPLQVYLSLNLNKSKVPV